MPFSFWLLPVLSSVDSFSFLGPSIFRENEKVLLKKTIRKMKNYRCLGCAVIFPSSSTFDVPFLNITKVVVSWYFNKSNIPSLWLTSYAFSSLRYGFYG